MYTLLQYRVIVCLCRCVSLLYATSSSPEPILLPLRWAFSILWWLFLLTRSAMCAWVCMCVCWIYLCYPAAYLFVRSRNMFDLFGVTCNKTGEISNVACNLLRYMYKSYNILRLFSFSCDIRLLFSILNSVYIFSLHMLLQNIQNYEEFLRLYEIILSTYGFIDLIWKWNY